MAANIYTEPGSTPQHWTLPNKAHADCVLDMNPAQFNFATDRLHPVATDHLGTAHDLVVTDDQIGAEEVLFGITGGNRLEGDSAFSYSETNKRLTVQNIQLTTKLQQIGDGDDTYLQFPASDRIEIFAGGVEFIDITEGVTDILSVDPAGTGIKFGFSVAIPLDDFHVRGTIYQDETISASDFVFQKAFAYGDNEALYLTRVLNCAEGTIAAPADFDDASDSGLVLYKDLWKMRATGAFQEVAKMEVISTQAGVCGHSAYFEWSSDDTQDLGASFASLLKVGYDAGVVINEGSDAVFAGFRVKSKSDTHIFFVDSPNDFIGIGVSDPDTILEIFKAGTQLKLSFDATNSMTLAVGATGNGTLTPSGKTIGIGVVPESWDSANDISAVQLRSTVMYDISDATSRFGHNIYEDSVDLRPEYITTDTVELLSMSSQQFTFLTAPSGSPNTAISLVEAFRITTTGIKIGNGTAGVDYTFTFDGQGSNIVLTALEDEKVLSIDSGFAAIPDEITATSAGVAAAITTLNTEVTTNGDSDLDNVTLADGVTGQIKRIYCVVEGNAADTWKITPATMAGGTQITFAGVGEGCTLVYAAVEGWTVVGNNGGTIS